MALSAVAAFFIKLAVTVAVSAISSAIQKAKLKKSKSQTAGVDFGQVVQRQLANGLPLELLVGRRIVGGVSAYDDSQANNEFGIRVTILSCKPCHSFQGLYAEGDLVTLAGDPTTGEQAVTSHFKGKGDVPRMWVRVFLGDDNSGLGTYLNGKFPTKFNATDNFGDYCVAVVICQNTDDDFDEDNNKNFNPFSSSGYPTVRFDMEGASVCDPRNPSCDYDDESTYVYSNNAKLIDEQFNYGWYSGVGTGRRLVVGRGMPKELIELNEERTKSDADYCDTEGFTCSGLLISGDLGQQTEIQKCFAGDPIESASSVYSVPIGNRVDAGEFRLSDYPNAYVKKHDPQGFSTEVPVEFYAKYSEPTERYAEEDLATVLTDPLWVSAANSIVRPKTFVYTMVTDYLIAAKLRKIDAYSMRATGLLIVDYLPMSILKYDAGDMVLLNDFDDPLIDGLYWVVESISMTIRGDCTVVFTRQPDAADIAFDPVADDPGNIVTPVVNRGPTAISPVRDLIPAPTNDRLTGITDGSVPFTDIVIVDRGSLVSAQDSQETNISSALSGGGGVTVSPSYAYATGLAGTAGQTNTVTVSVTGGTWSEKFGNTGASVVDLGGGDYRFNGTIPVGSATKSVFTYDAGASGTFDLNVTFTNNN